MNCFCLSLWLVQILQQFLQGQNLGAKQGLGRALDERNLNETEIPAIIVNATLVEKINSTLPANNARTATIGPNPIEFGAESKIGPSPIDFGGPIQIGPNPIDFEDEIIGPSPIDFGGREAKNG